MKTITALVIFLALIQSGAPAAPSALPVMAFLERSAAETHGKKLKTVSRAIEMHVVQSGLFRIMTREELLRALKRKHRIPPETCTDLPCLKSIGSLIPEVDYILGASIFGEGEGMEIHLQLVDVKGGLPAAQIKQPFSKYDNAIELSRKLSAALIESYRSYLKGKKPQDNEKGYTKQYAAFAGLCAASTALLAYRSGLLSRESGTRKRPEGTLPLPRKNLSHLRGFYALPGISAKRLGQGNAGIAMEDREPAPLMNPAGLVHLQKRWVNFIQASLPGHIPAFYLGYASALTSTVFQSIGLRYDGDALQNETTLNAAFATDLTPVFKYLYHLKLGIALKGYMISVGKEGTGLDRATGHSLGAGCDIGLQFPLPGDIKCGFLIRDAVSYLRHNNTLTGKRYEESLPPLAHIGFSYRVSPTFLFVMDGEKGLFDDQKDHVRLGASKTLFRFLQLRAGTQQIFDAETNRKITLGFGINGDVENYSLHINYGVSIGTENASSLNNIHQFSIDVGY